MTQPLASRRTSDDPAQLRLKADVCRRLADLYRTPERKSFWLQRAGGLGPAGDRRREAGSNRVSLPSAGRIAKRKGTLCVLRCPRQFCDTVSRTPNLQHASYCLVLHDQSSVLRPPHPQSAPLLDQQTAKPNRVYRQQQAMQA